MTGKGAPQLVMDTEELHSFLAEAFPQVAEDFTVDRVDVEGIRLRMRVSQRHLRPGGTVSGPSIFALADVGVYLALLSRLGPVALAVTTNCAIDFMRKPSAEADLIAEVRLLKLGRVLAVGDTLIHSDGESVPVARASLTYSIPPR